MENVVECFECTIVFLSLHNYIYVGKFIAFLYLQPLEQGCFWEDLNVITLLALFRFCLELLQLVQSFGKCWMTIMISTVQSVMVHGRKVLNVKFDECFAK